MVHIPEMRFGNAGTPGLIDPSGRSPIETSKYDSGSSSGAGGLNQLNGPYAPGVPVSSFRHFSFQPLTANGANLAALQTPSGAGALTLTAGTGVVAVTITPGGVNTAAFDITGGNFSRALQIVGQSGVTQRTYTITGYDEYNMLTTSVITGPNGNQTITTTKCWRYITSISVSGGTSQAVSIGTADTIGFPVAVFTYDQFAYLYMAAANIAASTGFTAADTTNPATSSTGHVRGTYALQTGSNGTRLFTGGIVVTENNAQNMNLVYGITPA